MSWNLQIAPKGLLLSKYLKNIILLNPNNVKNIERNGVLADGYQTFNQSNNTANIIFQLALNNSNPTNTTQAPDITGLSYIALSNDVNFVEVYLLLPAQFLSNYNSNTDYTIDLSLYNFSQSTLPASQGITFTESSGNGNIIIKNWILSGSSGLKKVFLKVSASLSDGSTVSYPDSLDVYDEITVLSDYLSSPGLPAPIGKSINSYVASPIYYEAEGVSNSGVLNISDSGVSAYAWDGLILTSGIVRNNYSQNNIQLFDTVSVGVSSLNQEDLPIVYTNSAVNTWAPANYKSYISTYPFKLSDTNNVYFFECYVNNYSNSPGYVNGNSFYYEINATNSTAATKYLRYQVVFDQTFKTLNIYISVDDATWSTDVSCVPAATYAVQSVTDPDVVAQIIQSGTFLLLIEVLDSTNKVYQSKLVFKPSNTNNNIILHETLFTSSQLSTSVDIYGEFRHFIQNTTSTVILESNQYGVCRGTLSAAVIPNDKIKTDYTQKIQNSANDIYNSELLNTWFVLSNSPASGVVGETSGDVYIYNNFESDTQNNLSSIEIQSNIPTFSENNVLAGTFKLITSGNQNIKAGYSFDSDLDFSDFTFSNLLSSSTGIYLPQDNSKYEFIASVNWSGSNNFGLSVFDVGVAQTCSISTDKTDSLFLYSKQNISGSLTPPIVIKTLSSISTSKTFNSWISTNGYSTSTITFSAAVVKNQGNVPISINTGFGLNTISPGEPYVVSPISVNSTNPTSFIISSNSAALSTSVNFLYDFGELGTIEELSLKIQIVEPPVCPATLPSFKYSVEVSDDFYNWVFVSDLDASNSFDPSTGNVTLLFENIDSENMRYARLRLYYDAAVTFDPRTIYRYSSMSGAQTANSIADTTGRLIFGFTDTSAKNLDLGNLYNQPTYVRKFVSNSSFVCGVVFDFSNYSTDVYGPVYINLLTDSTETTVHTINAGFNLGIDYSVQFYTKRQGKDEAFALQPSLVITGGDLTPIIIELDDILTKPSEVGFYPFVSLTGNGNINLSFTTFKGTFNQDISYNSDQALFSILSAENIDYSSRYGKNLITHNMLGVTSSTLPVVNTSLLYNTIKKFDHDNVTFVVKAATTSPIGLYGTAYIDGVYLAACDYALVAGQLDKSQNGVYQVQNKQWVKQNPNPSTSGLNEPTVLVEEGNVFENTLWMQDTITGDWYSNTVLCSFVLDNNNLLFTGVSTYYKYPQFVKLGVYSNGITTQSNKNQVYIKLLNSPSGYLSDTDPSTQWVGALQNNQLYELDGKFNANNTIFMDFSISSSKILGISTNVFPAVYNMVVSYSGNYTLAISENSDFVLPAYGSEYRIFRNNNLIYQMYSTSKDLNLSGVSTGTINASVYAINAAGVKSPQSGYSTDIYIDSSAPSVGILSVIQDNVKSVILGLSTVSDSGSGLALARFTQRTPANETFYSSWFGFSTNSFYGISTLIVYPAFVANLQGIATGEPLSGFYRYGLQVADKVGNIAESNYVESFYYESAIVDTQGPEASVKFVDSQAFTPISVSSSTIITAEMFAVDNLSQVKAFRYRILPDGEFGNWIDYNQYASIYLPDDVEDGILSVQFQFKDFGNNVLYSTATIQNNEIYVYTWNIVSRLISGTLFTVTEATTYNNEDVLLIGASKQNEATLFVWNNSKLIELQYSGFLNDQAVTALLRVGESVVIGTNTGRIYIYKNGVISGSYAQLKWGDTELPISKFELHQYPEETASFVYATTVTIPRIFRIESTKLKSLSWQVVQTNPVYMRQINVLNSGLWSGTNLYYSISSSYVAASLTPVLNYGIASVIVGSGGSGLAVAPTITVNGPIEDVGLEPVMQGAISQLVLIANGAGYTSGATVAIEPPPAGTGAVQATGVAITNSSGQIVSLILTNPGFGYTVKNPLVTITGIGSRAVASSVVQYSSIHSVNVTSAGVSTTTSITLSAPNGAILTPNFLYRFESVTINSPGFGYTSAPTVSLNGLTTLASATAEYGSIQSITVTGTATTFPLSQAATVALSGGVSTNYIASLSTTSISFSTGNTTTYNGFVLSSVGLTSSGMGFGTLPSISFSTSTGNIFEPELEYVLSDDLITYTPSGSIYDIKSFNDSLFITSSSGDVIEIGLTSGVFTATRHKLLTASSTYEGLTPVHLAKYTDSNQENLYFSIKQEPYIGKLEKNTQSYIFNSYRDDILLFKPYSFDIISNWQLKKILNTNGSANVSYADEYRSSVSISNFNSQVFYESSKENTWFNRCQNNNNYLVTLEFTANYGTQSFEISTFNSTLKAAFKKDEDTLVIYYGINSYSSKSVDAADRYSLSFLKNNSDLYIYNEDVLIVESEGFFVTQNSNPVIRFGYIFEPQELTANGAIINVFGLPNQITGSDFDWYGIKFAFNTDTSEIPFDYYKLSLPYALPNNESIRTLKNINDQLFSSTKSLTDERTTTALSDIETKVYMLKNETWKDVTGKFETYTASVSTSFVLASPNDINALGDSYFVTGLIKPVANRDLAASILLGLTTNVIYEEQENAILSIIYPYNPNPSGTFLTLSATNSIISLPVNIYFGANDFIKTIALGIGSTSLSTSSVISVSDGVSTSTISATILPIGISTLGLSTYIFTAYSQDVIAANIELNSIPRTNRTISFVSNNSSILNTPNSGVATVLGGNIGVFTSLVVGTTITSNVNVTLTASYRATSGIATILAIPHVLSIGVNTNYFTGNESVKKVYATASVQKSPLGILTVAYSSSNSGLLSTPAVGYILSGSFSTSPQLTIGATTTASANIFVTASIPGSIQTGIATAIPFTISTATVDYSRPVFGLQTATVTLTLSTTPQSNIWISNIVTSPTLPSLVFSSLSTVAAGGLTTTFGISTTLTPASGIAITVQGAPLGYNTTPNPGLTLVTDVWRITNLSITPTSIVGGGANSDGSTQSLAITATLNVGLATTVYISSSSSFIDTRNINFLTTGTGSASSTGYSTGFSTSLITGFAITATGPNGLTSAFYGLTLNPFLISSFSTGYIWNGASVTDPNYTVGGIGATVRGTVVLNAYVAAGTAQTVRATNLDNVYVYGQTAAGTLIGLATLTAGTNTAIIDFGADNVSSNISTNVTVNLVSYLSGLTTQVINIYRKPDWYATFYPIYSGETSAMGVSLQSSLPINTTSVVGVGTEVDFSFDVPALYIGNTSSYIYPAFNLDKVVIAEVSLLGSTQTYNVLGYANTGAVYGMGYNYYGELSSNYPVSGPSTGRATKTFMGLNNVVKTASGYHHNLALDDTGNVYAIGYNIYGQLGYSGVSTNIFRRVDTPESYTVNIFAQNNSSYIISADNNLYGFGQNNSYSFGTSGFASTSRPYLIATSVQIFSAYGDRGTFVQFNNKSGAQTLYEFGGGATSITSKSITQITYNNTTRTISNLVIHQVDTGQYHTVLSGTWTDVSLGVASTGVVAWGYNTYYQIGTSSPTGYITTPNAIHFFSTSGVNASTQYNNIFAENRLSGVYESYLPNNEYYVDSVIINTPGIGYTAGATVTFSAPPAGSGNSTALGYAVTDLLGLVTSVIVTNGGSGYNLGVSVTFSPPPYSASFATSTATGVGVMTGQVLQSITITDPGFGYVAPPTVYISPVSLGTGAIATSVLLQSQVIGIVVTSPGFGYTTAPSVTITSVLTASGSGATATAVLATDAEPVFRLYQVGSSVTSNATGFALTQTATMTQFVYSTDDLLYKISKNANHFVNVMQSGKVLVSGGTLGLNALKLYSTIYGSISTPIVFAQSSIFSSLVVAESQYYVIQNSLAGGYWSTYDGSKLNHAYTTKNALQPDNPEPGNSPAYQVTLMSDNTSAIGYTSSGGNQYKDYFLNSVLGANIRDVSVSESGYLAVNKVGVYLLAHNYTTGIMNLVQGFIDNTYDTVASKSVGISTTTAPIKIEGAWIRNYTQSGKSTRISNTVALAYANGKIEIYGREANSSYTVYTWFMINSWNISLGVGQSVTCIRSVNTKPTSYFGGKRYLYIADSSGKIYSYNADGSNGNNTSFTTLGVTSSLPAVTNITLDTQFGYVELMEQFAFDSVVVATSNNYIVVLKSDTLQVTGYALVPGQITSIKWANYASNGSGISTSEAANDWIFVSTCDAVPLNVSSRGVSNVYAYRMPTTPNYEMGLNYYNSSGETQEMTYDGSQTGTAVTSIIHASTNDTFTIIVDSSKDS